MKAGADSYLVHGRQVRVCQPLAHLHFVKETRQVPIVLGLARRQYFEGRDPVLLDIANQVDTAEAAFAQWREDNIAGYLEAAALTVQEPLQLKARESAGIDKV